MSQEPSQSSDPDESPKIIVDDDWKEQVQKEKAAESAPTDSTPTQSAPDAAPESGVAAESGGAADGDEFAAGGLPEPSLEVHVSMLFSQCLAALGQMPGPDGNPGEVNKPFAKHFIDTVEMLQAKTEGNVTDDEKKMMADVLHAMRMAFVGSK